MSPTSLLREGKLIFVTFSGGPKLRIQNKWHPRQNDGVDVRIHQRFGEFFSGYPHVVTIYLIRPAASQELFPPIGLHPHLNLEPRRLNENCRYIALQNDENGKGPLASYFKGEVLHGRDTDIFTSNMCKLFRCCLKCRLT